MKRREPNKVLGKKHSTREYGAPHLPHWLSPIKLGHVTAAIGCVTGSAAHHDHRGVGRSTREDAGTWASASLQEAPGDWQQGAPRCIVTSPESSSVWHKLTLSLGAQGNEWETAVKGLRWRQPASQRVPDAWSLACRANGACHTLLADSNY